MSPAVGSADASALSTEELAAVADRMARAGADLAGPLSARLIAGGRSNLTYRLQDLAAEDGRAWVLRMPPRRGRTPSAHDVAREFRVTSALASTVVPVPPAVVLCEEETALGLPFAVTEFVDGRTIQSRRDLESLEDGTLDTVVGALCGTLAALHSVDHVAVGLERFGRPDGYAARQVRRWSGQWEIVGDPPLTPLATELGQKLAATTFRQQSTGIVHGDYRIDNTLLAFDDGAGGGVAARVAAVVDWELSTIGDPVADVAMMCVYRHSALDLVLGEPSAWTSDRLPDADALAAAYGSAGGVELVDWDAHLALGYFKLAVIAAGIDHRYRAGATHGEGFDSAGQAVEPLLRAGLQRI
ncbi:phosphotransferase family protein [Nocardioides panacisoli]|uniref:phosphotransferase family protein n=1 Tax=Nocardioides panacisoli TaxID=627624 RepID=UPI001C62F05A|nr:phosphotransferase family protein [Nocardioides panacisoli]QYJ03569.1 phosphotransferase family protein [Nocardioides panacisoli]